MISGDEVPVDVSSFQNDTINFKDKDDVIAYLIHLGYLGYNEDKETAFVPNEELRLELIKATKRLGINYDKKTKIHECKIESFNTI